MVVFPNAKINLGLQVVGKRPDGYHNIATCFYPVPWCDILEVLPAEQPAFAYTGVPIPEDPMGNLCERAAEMLQHHHGVAGVRLHLHKVLPIGAGLGGGSADGAFALKAISAAYGLALHDDTLVEYAARLGSDCPFFIKNQPSYAQGRGDEFSPIQANLSGVRILIVKPNIHVSTADAYRHVAAKPPATSVKETIEGNNWHEWRHHLANDFEPSVFAQFPEIAELKRWMYAQGAVYASMSGSGAAVYGLFDQPIAHLAHPNPDYLLWQGVL